MNLIDKQKLFPILLCDLFSFARNNGYDLTLGEAWRPPETAALYAKEGKGIADSLHCLRLAIDLNIFKDGVLLSRLSDYKALGEYWESLTTADYVCCWGGRFNDADHFSISHNNCK